jgi:hypothetical protein
MAQSVHVFFKIKFVFKSHEKNILAAPRAPGVPVVEHPMHNNENEFATGIISELIYIFLK